MNYTPYEKNYVKIEELECFSNLLLRWPYDTPRKLFYKVSGLNFHIYELKGIYKDTSGSTLAKIFMHEKNEDKFDYFIDNYEYLFFLKKEIDILEKEDLSLALIPMHTFDNDDDIMCTWKSLGIVAAKSINAICVQECYGYVDDNEIDTFRVNGSLRFGTRNRTIQPERLWPKIPHAPQEEPTHLKKEELYTKGMDFVSLLRSIGQENPKVLAKALKDRYPRLADACLGRLIAPPGEDEKSLYTYRQRARRALGKIR